MTRSSMRSHMQVRASASRNGLSLQSAGDAFPVAMWIIRVFVRVISRLLGVAGMEGPAQHPLRPGKVKLQGVHVTKPVRNLRPQPGLQALIRSSAAGT